mgnify:CR=1 FL=1
MERLTKRKEDGIAYMSIADTLSKKDQIIEGSKPVLESLYAMFQKLAEFEDNQAELERLAEIGRATEKAFEEGYIFSYSTNRHSEMYDIDTINDLVAIYKED